MVLLHKFIYKYYPICIILDLNFLFLSKILKILYIYPIFRYITKKLFLVKNMNQPTKIFISYSHKDETHYLELLRHLNVVSEYMNLEVWSDQKIDVGDELDPEIQENLKIADIVICLVSTDYLTSYYCIEKELKTAISNKEITYTDIFPIITSPSLWQRTYFGTIKCAPKDGKPASKYDSLDEAYLEVVNLLMSQIERKQAEKKNFELNNNTNLSSQSIAEGLLSFINELGLKIKHPKKELLQLNDIFVYPDLEHITSRTSITYKELSSFNSLHKFNFQYIS